MALNNWTAFQSSGNSGSVNMKIKMVRIQSGTRISLDFEIKKA